MRDTQQTRGEEKQIFLRIKIFIKSYFIILSTQIWFSLTADVWFIWRYTMNLAEEFPQSMAKMDRTCDLVVRIPGYRSRGPAATRFSEK
jgi:hypothetical protein